MPIQGGEPNYNKEEKKPEGEQKKGTLEDIKEKSKDMKDKVAEKAKETKEKIAEKAEDAKNKIGEKKDQLKDKMSEKTEEMKEKMGEKKEQLKEKTGEMKEKIADKKDEAVTKVPEKTEEAKKATTEKAEEIKNKLAKANEPAEQKTAAKPLNPILPPKTAPTRAEETFPTSKITTANEVKPAPVASQPQVKQAPLFAPAPLGSTNGANSMPRPAAQTATQIEGPISPDDEPNFIIRFYRKMKNAIRSLCCSSPEQTSRIA